MADDVDAVAERLRDDPEVLIDHMLASGRTPTGWFPWKSAETNDPPRDGTEFVWMRTTRWVGGEPRVYDYSFEMRVLRRTWMGERPECGGFWIAGSDERGHSVDDPTARTGMWCSRSDFADALSKKQLWRLAPKDMNRVIVFVRPEHDHVEARAVWWDGQSWCAPIGPLHPGYLDGLNVGLDGYRWCELREWLPYTP